jgi:carbohydrate-binding DOMON domain-containing protein
MPRWIIVEFFVHSSSIQRRNCSMRISVASKLVFFAAMIILLGILVQPMAIGRVAAQNAPAVETTATEPPTSTFTPTATATATATPTNTNTPVNTDTPTATPTGTQPPTNTPTSTRPTDVEPPDDTVPIPEPVTVVLFGTGLAALSAAVAARRRKED